MQLADISPQKLTRDDLSQEQVMRSLVRAGSTLPDPRTARVPLHSLTNIVTIALCAVVADCNSWVQIADFAEARRNWFEQYLDLPYGTPSSDTFRRVFGRLNPHAFQKMLVAFIESLRLAPSTKVKDDRHLALDGKTLRASFENAAERSPLHLVQAMSTATHLVLAQVPTTVTDDPSVKKGNEITAINQLLDQVDVRDATITIDAIGCQKAIAAKIVARGGDYLLTLKDNHPTLAQEVDAAFEKLHSGKPPRTSRSLRVQNTKTRGRTEERYYTAMAVPRALYGRKDWAGLRSILQTITNITDQHQRTTTEVRYSLSTLKPSEIAKAARCLRRHWRIESAHWILDMTFGEDESRIRKGNGAENFAVLRRAALGLLKTLQGKPRNDGKKKPFTLSRLRRKASHDMSLLATIVSQRT